MAISILSPVRTHRFKPDLPKRAIADILTVEATEENLLRATAKKLRGATADVLRSPCRDTVELLRYSRDKIFKLQYTPVADVDGCLHLVAGENPELHASLAQVRDSGRHIVLQLILDGSYADHLQVHLASRNKALNLST